MIPTDIPFKKKKKSINETYQVSTAKEGEGKEENFGAQCKIQQETFFMQNLDL